MVLRNDDRPYDDADGSLPAANTPLQAHETQEFNPARSYAIEPVIPGALDQLVSPVRHAARSGIRGWWSGMMDSQWMRVIVGDTDSRQPTDTSRFPYRSIALLVCRSAQNEIRGYGTGFFISERCLITAGHCVNYGGRWMGSIEVIPGAVGTDHAPFGKRIATTFRSVNGWVRDRNNAYDYGAVILDDDSLFQQIGNRFGFDPSSPNLGPVEVAGYPKDRHYQPVMASGAVTDEDGFLLSYDADTEEGMSGGPIYDPITYRVKGVHTHGSETADLNYAVKLRPPVAKMWNDWSLVRTQPTPQPL